MADIDDSADLVVIGAGLAGAKAAETLRDEGHAGRLTIVGEEQELPYERPQLSKEFLKGSDFAPIHDAAWYADRDIRLVAGTRASALDRDAARVTLDTGESLSYDALLLATGARPRVPPIPGVERALSLRTIADARHLREAITPDSRVVLVGGGWIGLEVAAAAAGAGAHATVLEMLDLPLRNVLGPDLARYLADLHAGHGVEVLTGRRVTAIEPDGVVTDSGKVAADTVVVAVGAAPDSALAREAGLETAADGGIVVDEHLRTADPRIYAAGDVALATNTILGPLRVEHWDNALRQGRLAGRTMLGRDAAYDWLPYFYTDQFEFSMEYVGHSAPDDEVLVRGDRDAHEFIAYWLREGRVTAAMNVGIWDVNDKLREIVGTSPDPADLTDLR